VPPKTLSRFRWSCSFKPLSTGWTARPSYGSVSPRSSIHALRSRGSPSRMSVRSEGSVYGPLVS
jgi:hypothetical protein